MTPLQPGILPKAFFLPTPNGFCFSLFHAPRGTNHRGSVLYLHPFAEELNTTRRIVAHQARNLACMGYGVLQVDLNGCGDSAGDFGDATWSAWLKTARVAHAWLQENSSGPAWIWGLRAGALLAGALVHQLQADNQHPAHLLLWQPVVSGQQMLQQFLRLKDAAQWMGMRKTDSMPAHQLLAKGHPVEIAGYTISTELANELSQARLSPIRMSQEAKLVWLEVSLQSAPTLSPSAVQTLENWKNAGWRTEVHIVHGLAFWQTISMADAPALCQATDHAMATLSKPSAFSNKS